MPYKTLNLTQETGLSRSQLVTAFRRLFDKSITLKTASVYDESSNYFQLSAESGSYLQHRKVTAPAGSSITYGVLMNKALPSSTGRLFDNESGDCYLEFTMAGKIRITGDFTATLDGVNIESGLTDIPEIGSMSEIVITPTADIVIDYVSSPTSAFDAFVWGVTFSGVNGGDFTIGMHDDWIESPTTMYHNGTGDAEEMTYSNLFFDESFTPVNIASPTGWASQGDGGWATSTGWAALTVTSGTYDCVRVSFDVVSGATMFSGIPSYNFRSTSGHIDLLLFDVDGDVNLTAMGGGCEIANLEVTEVRGAQGHGFAESSSLFSGLSEVNVKVDTYALLESISLSVSNVTEDEYVSVKFKRSVDSDWSYARPLVWDPVSEAYTGSIVYLDESTTYDIEIVVNRDGAAQTISTTQATMSYPDIDPAKIYNLSDIYTPGEALVIDTLISDGVIEAGEADGWVKIVGDASTIVTTSDQTQNAAINIGENCYIYFQDVVIQGGYKHGFMASQAHHLWFDGCDVSQFGRVVDSLSSTGRPLDEYGDLINYDAGFRLVNCGHYVIENSDVHDPIPAANAWYDTVSTGAHPAGACCVYYNGKTDDVDYRGNIVIRNNNFYGADEHRFNDCIESNDNSAGGFWTNSAIYGNTMSYANDDCIELDGYQHNVLMYDNDISHSYSGISVTPCAQGPSFVFNNYVHDLGDQTGRNYFGVKAGGLLESGYGCVYLMNNLIKVENRGIADALFGDRFFWMEAYNNIILTQGSSDYTTIEDTEKYYANVFSNNYLYNLTANDTDSNANITDQFHDPSLVNLETATTIWNDAGTYYSLPASDDFTINNFSRYSGDDLIIGKQ